MDFYRIFIQEFNIDICQGINMGFLRIFAVVFFQNIISRIQYNRIFSNIYQGHNKDFLRTVFMDLRWMFKIFQGHNGDF